MIRISTPGQTVYLDVQASKVRDFICEATLLINGARNKAIRSDDTIFDTNAVIVFTKSRRAVNDTSTGIISNIGVAHNLETTALELFVKVVEEWNVFPTLHVLSLHTLKNLEPGLLGVLIQDLEALLQKNISVASQFILDFDIVKVGMSGQTNITGQGPRGGGPCQ